MIVSTPSRGTLYINPLGPKSSQHRGERYNNDKHKYARQIAEALGLKAFEKKHEKSFSALSLVIARVFGCKSASDLKGRAEARAAWAVVGRAREVAVLFQPRNSSTATETATMMLK